MLCEMLSASSRIWTRVAVSISYDDNHFTTGTSKLPSTTIVNFTYLLIYTYLIFMSGFVIWNVFFITGLAHFVIMAVALVIAYVWYVNSWAECYFIYCSFFYFIVIASRICKRFLLLFSYKIFVLLTRIFLISGDLSLSVSSLCFDSVL